MLAKDRNNNRFKFAALRLMNGNRISQVELHNIFFFIVHFPVVWIKSHYRRQFLIIYRDDFANIAIEDIEVVIVAAVDHTVAFPE